MFEIFYNKTQNFNEIQQKISKKEETDDIKENWKERGKRRKVERESEGKRKREGELSFLQL